MKLNALRDFLAVAEKGSLRGAARHLGSAQPALSHNIRELERELGVELFVRRPTGVVLTRMGESFHRRANAAIQELRRGQEELDQLRGETQGSLSVAMSSVPHIALLPTVLQPFRARYPGVKLDVIDTVYPGAEASLLDGSSDFYVGPAPQEPAAGLLRETLFENTRVIVGREGHPLAAATSLRDLVDAEWITSSITHKAEEELGPLFAQHGLPPPKLVMKSHSALTFLVSIVYSDLLMMLPVQWIQSPLFHAVRPILVRETLPAPPICLVRRAGMPLTPAGEFMCDLLRRGVVHLLHDRRGR